MTFGIGRVKGKRPKERPGQEAREPSVRHSYYYWPWLGLHTESAVLLHGSDLANDVILGYQADLTLPDDVHGFVSLNRVQSPFDGSEPLARRHAPLHETMILLKDIC